MINKNSKSWDYIHKHKLHTNTEHEDIKNILNTLLLRVKKNKNKILDIGCGAAKTILMGDEIGLDIYGCDVSSYAVQDFKVNNRAYADKVFLADSCSISLEKSSFDHALSIRTFDNMKFEEAQETVSEIHKLIKSKGLLHAVVKAKKKSDGFLGFYEDKILTFKTGKKISVNEYDKLKIYRLFEPLFKIRNCCKKNLSTVSNEKFWFVELEKR